MLTRSTIGITKHPNKKSTMKHQITYSS